MDNQNKKEYLDAIKALTLDNLRYLPHAPSVQMQSVPPDTLSFEDYGEAEDASIDETGGPELDKYGLQRRPHYHEYYDSDRDNDRLDVTRLAA